MKDPWFRRDGPMHWMPISFEGWAVLLLFVFLGVGLGETIIFWHGPTTLSTFVGMMWIMASIFGLVFTIIHTDDRAR